MQKQMGAAEPAAEIAVQCSRHLNQKGCKENFKGRHALLMLGVYCFLFLAVEAL